MKDFRNLLVWRKSHQFVLELYKATERFPREEIYGLKSQIRRASMSVPTNIAEGCGRHGDAELARFCQIAMGSASEVEYQLLLARDLGYMDAGCYQGLDQQLTEVRRMLNSLIQRLRAKS